MKLHSHIARYIRRCGYALAFTLGATCLHANTQDVVIEYLTEETGMPAEIVEQVNYEADIDVTRPDTTGITPWGTTGDCNNIVDHVKSGEGVLTGYCPWRRQGSTLGFNYEIFIPNQTVGVHYTTAVTNDSTTYVYNAIRPTIQSELLGPEYANTPVKKISYIGARSLLPATVDGTAYSYYTQDDIVNGILTDAGTPVSNKWQAVYDADGNPLTNSQGQQLYTDRTSNQYYKKVYADDDDMVGTLVALNNNQDLGPADNCGDNTVGLGRGVILCTDAPVDVCNNNLIISHSGFALAMGAYTQYGDAYNNYTYIQDVRVSDDIYGASTVRGNSYDNTLVVVRAQCIGDNTTLSDEAAGVSAGNFNNSGKVYAVYSSSKETNDAYDNVAFLYGTSTYQPVGGAVAGGNAYDNLLFITHSEIATSTDPSYVYEVMGGYSTRIGSVTGNLVVVDDTFDADAAGIAPEVRDETVAGGWTSSVPEVSTIHTDIMAGVTDGARATSNAENNKLILIGSTASDGSRTSVEGNVFGGFVYNAVNAQETQAASANGNIVVLQDVDMKNTAYAPILRARGTEDNIWGSKTTRTDVGRICGGFAYEPTATNTAPGNTNDNTVIVINSKVANSIYGGSNEGNGQANNNALHLSHVDTKGTDGRYQNRVFYGGWINSYLDGGQANNNHVWLYDSGWSMDQTFLHGGWGNELAKNAEGVILGAGGTPLIAGATSFDGTTFYDASNKELAKLQLSKVVKNNADGSTSDIFGNATAFDGETFFNSSRKYAGGFEDVAIMNVSNSVDIIRAATDISKIKADGNVDFYTDDESGSVIATWYADSGEIRGLDNKVLASGIASYNESTETFYNANGTAVYQVVRGAIINGSTVKAYGITSYEFDDASGNLQFKDKDGNVVATFLSSTIVGTDSNGDAVAIDIKDQEVSKNGINMVRRGDVNSVFAKIDGFNEYETYTRGNWLHIAGFQGKLKGFDHFEKLHFVFSEETDISKPLITITGDPSETGLTIVKEEGGDPVPVEVSVDISEIADQLKPGDVIPVIGHEDQSEIAGLDEIPEDVVDAKQKHSRGVTSTFTLDTEFKEWTGGEFDNFGVIEVMDIHEEATPEAKALVEGRIAMLTLNNMGGNLVAEQGIDSACRALEGTGAPGAESDVIAVNQNGKGGVTYKSKDELEPGNRLFFAMNGAHNKVDSGSDVDVDGTNAIVGVARGLLAKRALTIGAFMETGWGKYHTHNNFGTGSNVPTVRGTGETSYVGAGALLRYHLRHLDQQLEGLSLDASLRAGRQETDYSTADLMAADGSFASYEHESDYIAGHVGLNYTFAPADKLAATLYARYLWTHISNDEGVVCGETVNFEDMSSNRFRFGGRLTWQASEKWSPYVGMAYEWECSGTARAATYGAGITAPSMRGGSFIGEIGAVWQPSLSLPLWIEAALQGSVGKNENYGAKIGISIGF